MAEPDKRQIGDGSDNYGEAAKQMAKAAKEAGIETAKQAAVKGAEAGANAAAATVQAGVEGGKAVAEIAAGTAAGGPWGAILSAAWAMRHTLFKILVCICLFFLVIIVLIVSLPSVVTNSVFGLDGSMVDMENPTTLLESYNHLAADISAVVEEGYDAALAKVEQIIEDGGYDYDLSMDALINYAQGSAGYDVSYILAAYSASLQQRNTGKEDMLAKLRSVADSMFPVSFVEKESEQIVPFTYATYRPVTVTVVTSKTQTGTINGVPQYRYREQYPSRGYLCAGPSAGAADGTVYHNRNNLQIRQVKNLDEREYNNVYAIPANYTDSGKLLGGMIDTRNAIETVILVLALGYPELILIPMPGTIRIVVMTVTLLPLAVVSAMGVDGGSLFQYIGHIIHFWTHRRKLHFRRIGYRYGQSKRKKKPQKRKA